MMERPDALEHFRGKSRYNCAQAVLKAYAPLVGLEDICLERFSHFGSGQAPEGECGALFAAKAVFQDSVVKQEIENEFIRAAGNKKCRDIRKGKTFTCGQCVQTAADAVFLRLGDGHVLQRPTECNH
jgi:hypothetical protein